MPLSSWLRRSHEFICQWSRGVLYKGQQVLAVGSFLVKL